MNLHTKFDKNQMTNGSAIVDTSLKMNQTESKLTRMRVHYFRCYWPSNVDFDVRCETYSPNLKKIGQKTAVAIVGDRYFGQMDKQTDK